MAVRETGDKIQIIDQDHDSMALALERALERFGPYLDFDGNQAGPRTLVDIVVTHDLRVTFTDDRLNAQIQLRRVHNDLDRGRSIAASEQAQKRGAGASTCLARLERSSAGEFGNEAGGALGAGGGQRSEDLPGTSAFLGFVTGGKNSRKKLLKSHTRLPGSAGR